MCSRAFGSDSSAVFPLLPPPLPVPSYGAAARSRPPSRSSRAVMAPMRPAAVPPMRSKPSEARWRSSWWNAASEGTAMQNCHLRQLRLYQQARRAVLGRSGLALKQLGEDGERVEHPREAPGLDCRPLRRVAPREASVEVMQHGGERHD